MFQEKSIATDRLIESLFKLKSCINFSNTSDIEAQVDFKSPIFLNMKAILDNYETRTQIGNLILNSNDFLPDLVCGMESGGNYLVTYIGDQLKCPISYFRRTPKEYGEEREYIGSKITSGKNVLFIDDVIATGKSLKRVTNYFQNRNCFVKAFYIFSYGFDDTIAKELDIKINTLFTLDDLLLHALKHSYINKSLELKIREHVVKFRD